MLDRRQIAAGAPGGMAAATSRFMTRAYIAPARTFEWRRRAACEAGMRHLLYG
jgi:hypothetical protein